jgi:nitrite reductase/ring-hydroxylating ferredoxin subunit
LITPKKIDTHGRCCGRKPIHYKRPPRLFCPRCDAEFDVETGEQVANWAYRKTDGDFEFVYEHMKERLS